MDSAAAPAWPLARRPERLTSPSPLVLNPERNRSFPTRIDAGDPVLVPLLQELGQMQQQMAEQFQQALMMMFQLFSGMHQDQMALIRQELAEIRRLSQEQQALQAELARHAAPADPPLISTTGPAPAATTPGGTFSGATPAPPPPQAERPSGPPPGPTASTAAREGDLHAFLSQRLVAIQEEQQSRWQKLLRSVVGRDPLAEAKS